MIRRTLCVLTVLCVAVVVLLHSPYMTEDSIHELFTLDVLVQSKKRDTAKLFFVGDIMLGRGVESRILEEGIEYPFEYAKEILNNAHLTVGNFEGVVQKHHTPTPMMTFQFSIHEEYLKHLKTVGFDILSLANNHSLDYGTENLLYTRDKCLSWALICGGSPNALDGYSSYTALIRGRTVGFLFLDTTWRQIDGDVASRLLKNLAKESETQIAFIHWGDEYNLVHNEAQETLAHLLIDNGIDVVIGHHPHVIQDVELYKGKPIFYSLGNFIFDQYFSDEVQEGLGVEMQISDTNLGYRLVPFTSKASRNQPQRMDEKEDQILYARIMDSIKDSEGVSLEKGEIMIKND